MIIGSSTLQNIILLNRDTFSLFDSLSVLILPMWIEGEILILICILFLFIISQRPIKNGNAKYSSLPYS